MSDTAQPSQGLHMSRKSWALLILLSLIWGSSFIANEIALTHFAPFTVVAFRVSGGALALMPVLFILRQKLPRGLPVWGLLLFIGAFNNALPFSLIVWGQQHIDAGLASVINATTPIMTVVIAHFLTHDEKMNRRKLVGIAMGFLGIMVLFNPGVLSFSGMAFWGQLALIGASLAYAVGVIMLRKLAAMGVTPVQGAIGQLLASSIIMLPVALISDQFYTLPFPPRDVVLSVIVLTVFCSALAYLIYFTLTREAGATNASLVTVTIPPFTIVMGVALLGESFSLNDGIGMVMITLGLMIKNGYIQLPGKRKTTAKAPLK